MSEKCLQETDCKDFSKAEIQLFKKVYCYLSRILTHNMNEVFLYQNLAEYIWRKDKEFGELYNDLKNNLLNVS